MTTVTQKDIDATHAKEVSYGTTRCLPLFNEIPEEFHDTKNIYNRMIDSWYIGEPLPKGEVKFKPGFREDGQALKAFINAHINSFSPSYERKIAGCAYLLSQIIEVTE